MSATNPPAGSGKPGDSGSSRPAKADWRGKAKAAAPGGRASAKKGALWREKSDQEFQHARRRYRITVISLIGAVVGLIALFVWIVLWPALWKRTPFFALAVTGYQSSPDAGDSLSWPGAGGSPILPPNWWAGKDLQRFEYLNPENGRIADYCQVSYAPHAEDPRDGFRELREKIAGCRGGGPTRHAVIVYLSVHGAVNGEGRACLVPPGGKAWLPLDELLIYLFPREKSGKLPEKKLLILDCNRMDANWGIGLLYNGFADALKRALEDARGKGADVAGLVILNSTGPGQIGWTSPEEFQGSVFGYYVFKGLMGFADRSGEGDGNGKVTLSELYRYVSGSVKDWVRDHRADEQAPLLVPDNAGDFPLVFAPFNEGQLQAEEKKWAASASGAVDRARAWSDVAELWKKHAELDGRSPEPEKWTPESDKGSPWRWNPLGWEEFQQGLLRLEDLLLAGEIDADELAKTRKRLLDRAADLQQDPLAGQLKAYRFHSLPLATRFSGNPSTSGRSKADVVEAHFLRMLQEHLDPDVRNDQAHAPLLKQAAQARDAAESVAAPFDERVHYWIQRQVDAADAERRRAEDGLFVGDPGTLSDAKKKLDALVGADGRGGQYGEARIRGEAVWRAFAVRDRACAKAPYLAEWLLARLHDGDPARRDKLIGKLFAMIQVTQELSRELDEELGRQAEGSLPNGGASPTLAGRTKALAGALTELEGAFREDWSRVESLGDNRQKLKRLRSVLAVPLVTGAARNLLRRHYLEALPGGESKGPTDRIAPGKEPAEPAESATEWTDRLTKRGKHPAWAILNRRQLEDDESPVRKPPAPATRPPAESASQAEKRAFLAKHGEEVRALLSAVGQDAAAWCKESEKALRLDEPVPAPAKTRPGYGKADRLVHAAAAFLPSGPVGGTGPPADPVSQLRRLDLRYLLLWHCRRTLDDFWGPPPEDNATASFFETAAEDYLSCAERLCQPAGGRPSSKSNLRDLLESRRKAAQAGIIPSVDSHLQVLPGKPPLPVKPPSVAAGLPPGEAAFYLKSAASGQVLPLFPSESEARQPASAAPGGEKQPASGLRRVSVKVAGSETQPKAASGSEPGWYWISGGDKLLEEKSFRAFTLYRGHRQHKDVTVVPLGEGREIVFEPPKDLKATVRVKGTRHTESYVVFIVDYSGTMNAPLPAPETRKRYQAARDTLSQVLTRLAAVPEKPYRVGVMVYGHRVNYASTMQASKWPVPSGATYVKFKSPDSTELVSADEEVKADKPGRHPGRDVEMIWPPEGNWPPGPLTENGVRDIEDKVKPLRPVGFTPLYLSIQQAANKYLSQVGGAAGAPVGVSRHIIVITDGLNDQPTAGLEDQPDEIRQGTGAKDVRDALDSARTSGREIRLDVIGFNLAEGEPEKLTQLRQLTKDHGGDYSTAGDASVLAEQLRKSLRLNRYVVYPEGTPPAGVAAVEAEKSQELDTAWPIGDLEKADREKQPTGAPYLVRIAAASGGAEAKVQAARVKIQGGEALRLFLSKDALRLEHERYRENLCEAPADDVSRSGVKAVAEPERKLFVAAHVPEVIRGNVGFFFSIQNDAATEFSERPAEAWVEIRPVLKEGEAPPPYVFYDLQLKPGCPVPLLQCTAPKWSDEARQAEVRLWCKFKKTPFAEELTVDELKDKGRFEPKTPKGIWLELRRQPEEKGDLDNVTVIEKHERPSDPSAPKDNLSALRIEMDPPPEKAVHHYYHDPQVRTVVHTFSYKRSLARQVGSFKVRITPREKIVEGAFEIDRDKPLRVPIPKYTAIGR